MKKRYLYSLLFGIPGLFVAAIISIFFFGTVLGTLWLFVFGDNLWPSYWEMIVSALFIFVVLIGWSGFILLGYFVGKRLEGDPTINRNHVWISLGLTAMFLLLILVHQWSVGNIGLTSDSALCSEFCAKHGFSGSGMPPANSGDKICSCYDDSGDETLRIPLDHLAPDFPK